MEQFFETEGGRSVRTNFDIVAILNNRYEVMAYSAQAWTTALGATPGVRNVAANVDITTLWPSPDPLGNNYSSHFYHSAEFRGDSVAEWNYSANAFIFSYCRFQHLPMNIRPRILGIASILAVMILLTLWYGLQRNVQLPSAVLVETNAPSTAGTVAPVQVEARLNSTGTALAKGVELSRNPPLNKAEGR